LIIKYWLAQTNMLTEDVRIDPQLNEAVWVQGVRNLPRKIRVRLSRRKKEEEDSKGKYYTHAQHVSVDSFKGLKNEVSKD
jgi:large subunit ribosomal protein L31e